MTKPEVVAQLQGDLTGELGSHQPANQRAGEAAGPWWLIVGDGDGLGRVGQDEFKSA